jgi:site-specific recombinase XerC
MLAASPLLLIPVRSRTLVALRIGKHLVKTGDLWALDILSADTKSRRPLDYSISRELSARIDLYLERVRCRIPGAEKQTSLWASNQGRPMCAVAIYDAVRNSTRTAFGFAVNLHRFRHAAASFWSIRDPMDVRGVEDLLGQASFGTTEKHYIMRSRALQDVLSPTPWIPFKKVVGSVPPGRFVASRHRASESQWGKPERLSKASR